MTNHQVIKLLIAELRNHLPNFPLNILRIWVNLPEFSSTSIFHYAVSGSFNVVEVLFNLMST